VLAFVVLHCSARIYMASSHDGRLHHGSFDDCLLAKNCLLAAA
jgi:hypothetical protein